MVIKKQLKEYIYGVISEVIPIKEFEEWLYTQTELVDDLENELNLDLFLFDYKQRGSVYEFTKIVLPFLEKADLELWKSKAYLLVLASGKEDDVYEKVLGYLNDWDYEGPSELHYLGYSLYDYWSEYGDPIDKVKNDLRKEALSLLLRVTLEEIKIPGFDIYKFPYLEIDEEEVSKHVITQVIKEVKSTKWWQVWRS